MIEEVLHPNNMMKALQSVVSNGGSAGVDGMGVKDLKAYYRENKIHIPEHTHPLIPAELGLLEQQ